MAYVGGADNSNSIVGGDDTVYPGGSSTFDEHAAATGGQQPTPTSSNGWNLAQGIRDVGSAITGNTGLGASALIPAWAQALQQWNNAGKYEQLGQDAANRADPFGQYRQYYGDKLRSLYDDPSQIANTPGYKFALNQALDATQGRLSSAGYGGTGTMADALSTQASGLAQQTFNQERNALMQMAGSQFDPANAANMMMRGGELAVNSRNAALAAMFYPFGPGASGTTVNNNNGGSGSGGNGRISPSQALQRLQQAGINPRDAANLMRTLVNDPSGISDGDRQLLTNLGIYDDSGVGGVDFAPGSYDSTGFGGWGDASGDPTLSGINFGGSFDPTNYDDIMGNTGFDPGNYTASDIDMSGFQIDPWG